MKKSNTKLWFSVLLMSVALLWASSSSAATPDHWKDTGFSINANGMKLKDVLREFGLAYGVRVSIEIQSDIPMKGKLRAESGSEFLDRLTQAYQFRWFIYNDTLYVVPRNDNASMRLEVGEDAVQDAKAALVGLGLFDSRFGWGELPDEGIVVVSGPHTYVELVRGILLPTQKKSSSKSREVMIFRLKYASATDRVITVRGESETIPGIKSILSNLLEKGGSYEKKFDGHDFDMSSRKKSLLPNMGKGDARENVERNSDGLDYPSRETTIIGGSAERSSKSKQQERDPGPRIDADPSLNAIFIYDDASKRAMYQSLITELDIEPQQVEIEALIVDINRNQLSDMGVEWGVTSGNTTATINSANTPSKGLDLPLPGATLLISNAARFYARLKALEETGDAHVLGKPTVLTLDNVAAVLDLSQTTYLPLVGERVANLADVTAGTMLRVVPRIVRDGAITRVRMEINIEDGSLGDSTGTSANVTRSSISTQAIIEPQQTLMIGGYHSESTSNSRQKVPLLGDVPLLGGLFRSSTESHNNRERLFLITPRLSGTTGVQAAKYSKTNQAARSIAALNVSAALPAQQEPNSAPIKTSVEERPVSPVPLSAPAVDTAPPQPAPRRSNSASALAMVEKRSEPTVLAHPSAAGILLRKTVSAPYESAATVPPIASADRLVWVDLDETARGILLRMSMKLKCVNRRL